MVVILVIGVIMAITVPNLVNAGAKAHQKGCEANQRLIRAQLENYKLETGSYPTGTNDEIFQKLIDTKLLAKEPECPAGGDYTFRASTSEGTNTVVNPDNFNCSLVGHEKLGLN